MDIQFAISDISDFIGSKDVIDASDLFFQSPCQTCMMIVGQSGCGKTTLCKLMINKYNVCYFRPVYEDYTTHKELVDSIEKFINTRTMLEIFEKREKLLFLDDIETLITLDRYANSYVNNLVSILKKSKKCKVILTCSAGQEKKVTELKKKMLWYKMQNPSVPELHTFVTSLIRHTKCDVDIDDAHVLNYIRAMHSNVRAILSNSHMLFNKSFDADMKHEELKRTTHDKNITDIVASIVSNKESRLHYIDVWLSAEPVLICYISYDNKHKCNGKNPLAAISKVVDAYASTSIMETVSYNKNDWFLSDVCNLYRFASFKSQCKDEFQPDYTSILTKTSQYFTLLKKQKEMCSKMDISPKHMYLYTTNVPKTESHDCVANFNKLKQTYAAISSTPNVPIQRAKRTK